ncbi:MAG: matrixin family metalloprotease, partial [Polyangiaceae bacterium]
MALFALLVSAAVASHGAERSAESASQTSFIAAPTPEHPVVWWTPATPPATWPPAKLPVAFTLSLPDPRDLKSDALAELDVALRSWGHVGCTAWRGVIAGRALVTGANDGVNAIIWHDDVWPSDLPPGVAAQTVVHTDATGNVVDTDIHLNGVDFKWSLDGAVGTNDARSILTHELGHALGLGHSSDSRATMYAGYPGGISWRSLEQDDKDGICALYPGTGSSGCDVGAACPGGFVCVAGACERTGTQGEVCSPCVREADACAGAGDDARCIDIGSGETAGRVCGRACAQNADCGNGFHCAPTTTSGDRQCISDDACASGPDRCSIDGDCVVGVCRSGACVEKTPMIVDAGVEASPDAGMTPLTSHGGCAVAPGASLRTRVD